MEHYSISTGSYVLLLATGVSILSAVRAYRSRDLTGFGRMDLSGTAIILLGGCWMLTSAMEQFFPIYSSKLLWSTLQYLPIAFIPVAWFVFAIEFSGYEGKLRQWFEIPLLIASTTLSVLALTNSAHSFLWNEPIFLGPSFHLEKTFNVGHSILIGYVYLVLLAGALVVVQSSDQHTKTGKSQILIVLLALLFPICGSIAEFLTDRIVKDIDLTPLGFALSTWLIAWRLPDLRLTQIVDVSQDYVLDQMKDAVLILSRSEGIIKANRAAVRLLGKVSGAIAGKKLESLAPDLYERISNNLVETKETLEFELDGEKHYFEPEISSIAQLGKRMVGQILVLHDITERIHAEQIIREGEERYRKIAEGTGAILITVNKKGRILYANESAEKIIGYGETDTIVGDLYLRFVHPDDREWVGEFYLNQFLTAVESTHIEFRIVSKTGDVHWLSLIADPWERNGEVCGLTGIAQDITERKEAELGLIQSEERFALAAHGANDGLWDWNLVEDHIYFSPRWEEMIGCPEGSVENIPDAWFSRIHPEDLVKLQSQINKHIEGKDDHLETEYRIQHSNGEFRWMLCRGLVVRDRDGIAWRIAGSQTDITDRKLAETQLQHDAFHDSLTGLPNRTLFMDRLGRVVERVKRYPDHQYSVLFLDIDRFKEVNDQLGHSLGDIVLFELAGRMKKCIRAADTIARHGGDEFSILLDEVKDISDSTLVAQRIQGELALPLQLEGHEISLSASIGIVLSQSGYVDAETIMRDADIAMYRAKSNGKARFEIFDSSMRDQLFARLELENALQEAVDKEQLFLQYQPIISLADDQVCGFEALTRWQHPDKGLISPGEFIPLAEETGLIREIDRWVITTAAHQLADWQLEFPHLGLFSMSVNVSGRNFGDPDLVSFIEDVLEKTGIAPETLHLEITESSLMENAETTGEHLRLLKALGVEIQIDDFGTGYSSLGYLQQFPIDTIKVDRTFVTRIGSTNDQREIVQTILSLAESLGMQAIAEGVETLSQRDFLRSLDCEFGQGFYYSKAVSADQIPTFLEKGVIPQKQAA